MKCNSTALLLAEASTGEGSLSTEVYLEPTGMGMGATAGGRVVVTSLAGGNTGEDSPDDDTDSSLNEELDDASKSNRGSVGCLEGDFLMRA